MLAWNTVGIKTKIESAAATLLTYLLNFYLLVRE